MWYLVDNERLGVADTVPLLKTVTAIQNVTMAVTGMYRHPQKNPRFPPGGVLKSASYGHL
ncbi:MAG: hypothetical protein ACK518_03245 [bacterium]